MIIQLYIVQFALSLFVFIISRITFKLIFDFINFVIIINDVDEIYSSFDKIKKTEHKKNMFLNISEKEFPEKIRFIIERSKYFVIFKIFFLLLLLVIIFLCSFILAGGTPFFFMNLLISTGWFMYLIYKTNGTSDTFNSLILILYAWHCKYPEKCKKYCSLRFIALKQPLMVIEEMGKMMTKIL